MNNMYMRTRIGELEHLISDIKITLESSYGMRNSKALLSVKSSLTACHEQLSNIVWKEEHKEPEPPVRRFWKMSNNNIDIEEISEEEWNELNNQPEFKDEDAEDPTTNDIPR